VTFVKSKTSQKSNFIK